MTNMGFLKGMCVGLIVGSAVGMAAMPRKKSGKTVVCRVLRTVGDVLDGLMDGMV